MIVLIIIGIVLFILAMINWGQSEGYLEKLFKAFGHKVDSDLKAVHDNVVSKTGGATIIDRALFGDFAFDGDYAYNDDCDYSDGV